MDEVDEQTYKTLFFQYYSEFFSFAFSLLGDKTSATNSTTEAFFMLWKKRIYFEAEKDIKAFLYNTIRNGCFNFLKYRQKYPDTTIYLPQIKMDPSFPDETLQEMLAYVARET